MTTDELRQFMEGVVGRVEVLEQVVAGQQNQMQIAASKFLEVNGELNYLKGQVGQINASGGSKGGFKKEILESRAIQSLGNLSGAKEYRQWNQRFKNALDQARPKYGRQLLNIIESVTERTIEQQRELSEENSVTRLIAEIIMEKVDDSEGDSKIDEDVVAAFDRELWAVLVDKCEGEAIHKVNSAEQGEGMWAYIRAYQWFNTTTELVKMSRIIDIMRPEACKYEHEIAAAVEKRERNYKRIIDEDKAEPLPERYRMTAIKCLLVREVKRHVTLRENDLSTDTALRDVIMRYAVDRRIEKERGDTNGDRRSDG